MTARYWSARKAAEPSLVSSLTDRRPSLPTRAELRRLALGPDGCVYVCNNGGLSFSTDDGVWTPLRLADDHNGGSIQRVPDNSGEVETVFTECDGIRLGAPNDLVFDRSGRCCSPMVLDRAFLQRVTLT
jgi:hypothetical protein